MFKLARMLQVWISRIIRTFKPIEHYEELGLSYEEYKKLQTERYQSFESSVEKWRVGQERYIRKAFESIDRDKRILDIACGDGVGLRYFRELGFKEVVGVELSKQKANMARNHGYRVIEYDMNKLSEYAHELREFDIIYSSHTLEHCFYPLKVLEMFKQFLRRDGRLLIVFPYPDMSMLNERAHGGKYELGTHIDDSGDTLVRRLEALGYEVVSKEFDQFREPEIWLELRPLSES